MTDTPMTVHWSQSLRTAVRPIVTLMVLLTYCIVFGWAVVWLLQEGETDNALALLGGIAGTTSAIVGFWFGTRGKGGLEVTKDSDAKGMAATPPHNTKNSQSE